MSRKVKKTKRGIFDERSYAEKLYENDISTYVGEVKPIYDQLEYEHNYYKNEMDWYDYDKTKVNKELVKKAREKARDIGIKKCTGKFDEVPQLEAEILDLISQMNVDTRKKFKQNMWLERGSQAGERVFDDILKYLKNQPQKTTSRKRQNNNPFQRKNVHKSNFMDRIANVSGVRLKKKK